MPIATTDLNRNFIIVNEMETVAEVRDRVDASGSKWTYIVVELAGGKYAVLRLGELIERLQKDSAKVQSYMLAAKLAEVPDLLTPRAADAVEQSALSIDDARERGRQLPGERLVVLAGGQVVGLVTQERRALSTTDLDWLNAPVGRKAKPPVHEEVMKTIQAAPEAESPFVLSDEMPPSPQPSPAATPAPEKRFINAELEGHDKNEPLQVGETYTLVFDVDVEARASAVATDGFNYLFQTDEQLVQLTVRLESKDFDIFSDPQNLRVPRTGKSKNKARFDISPKRNGEGVVNAIFLKDGNFIQLLTLKLNVGQPAKPAVLDAESLGRDLSTALVVQPRDVTFVIRNTGTGFDLIMLDAATTTAFVPVTLPELNQMIADARQALLDVVNYRSGATQQPDYQAGIDISLQANQFALTRLSRAGFRLYRKIFYGPAAGADSNLIGDRLRQLAEGEATLKIHVSSQQFLLPWGMLYLAEEYDPDHIDAKRFLGLRHMIEHLPLQRTQVPAHPLTMDSPSKLTISLNVNGDIDQRMRMPLIASQLTYWDGVQQTRGTKVIVRKTVLAVKQALADATTADEILYFFCHASSKMLSEGGGPDTSTLLLSDDGRLTLGDLEDEAPIQKMLPNAPLVFINACESAELSPLFYDGFVPYFIAKGARGVIGTECSTPALFAAEWAKCFFDRFLTGEPLGQVFLGLRREFYESHNNLMGLLYALYCDGDTQVAKI